MKNSQNKIINEIGSAHKPDLFPLIVWIYRWRDNNGQSRFRASTAFWELTKFYYFEN